MATGLKNKFVYQLIISATQVLVPLISYPYITRVLGPGNLGRVNYVDFVSQLFIMFSAFGIPFYAVREIARVRHDARQRAKLIQELLYIHACFSITATLLFTLITYQLWGDNFLLYLFAILNILISAFTFDWYIQGMEAFRFAAFRTLIVRLGLLISFFIFVRSSGDYKIYAGIFTVGFIINAIFNLTKLLGENKLTKQRLDFRQHFRPLWHFFLTTSAIGIYIYFDTVLLQYFTNNEVAVGYYTTTVKLVKICLVVILSIGTVMMPRLSFLVSKGDLTEIKKNLDHLLHFVITLGLPVVIGLLVLAPEIMYVIAGEKFMPAVPVMRILSPLPLLIGLSNIFCFQTLVPFKKEDKFLIVVIIGSLTSILLNTLLTPSMQEKGAAIANLATEFVITVIAGYYAHKTVAFAPRLTVVLQTVFASLLFIPVIFCCRHFFNTELAVLLISTATCIFVYIMVQMLLFKNLLAIELYSNLNNFIHKKNK